MSLSTLYTVRSRTTTASPARRNGYLPPRCPRGPDIAADAAHGRGPLQADLVQEQHERARDVEAVGEEGPVPGVGLLLRGQAADGEDDLVGVAREQVAAAAAAVGEEPAPGGVPLLDDRAVGGRRARHHPPDSFSTQRKAGMSSLEPSRRPA